MNDVAIKENAYHATPLNKINIRKDIYIFMCCNVRDKIKACGNDQTEFIYEYFRRSINQNRCYFQQGHIVKVNKTGCLSRCADGPNIAIFPENIWYTYQTTEDIDEIIKEHLIHGRIVNRLLNNRSI